MAELIHYESPGTYGGLVNDRRRSVWGWMALVATRLLIAPLPFILVGGLLAALPILLGARRPQEGWAVMAPLPVVLLLACGIMLVRTMRKRRGAQLLSYVEQAVRLNLPLPRMLRAAEDSEGGPLRSRLRSVREAVEAGAPLGIAMEVTVPEVPDRAVQLIKAAERLGRLPAVLRRLVLENRRPQDNATSRILSVVYPIGIMTCLIIVLGLLGIFVMPKFELIMRDYKVAMPWTTRWLLVLMRELALPLVILAALALLLYVAARMWELFAPPNSRGGRWLWADAILWWVPVLHGVLRDRGLADAFGVMSQALGAGHTLDRGLMEASELRINGVLRRRLERWLVGIQRGLSSEQAARAARLPALVVGMVSTASSGGPSGGVEVYDFLARYYDSRHSRTAALLRASVGPVLAIVFGAAVALTAMGMFMPLVEMTRQLSIDPGNW